MDRSGRARVNELLNELINQGDEGLGHCRTTDHEILYESYFL